MELVDQKLKWIGARVQQDITLWNLVKKNLFHQDFEGPGELTTLSDLKTAVKSSNTEGRANWPEAKEAWKAFTREYGLEPRNQNNMNSKIEEVARGLNRPGSGRKTVFIGGLTKTDFDRQELSKLREIRDAGPRGAGVGGSRRLRPARPWRLITTRSRPRTRRSFSAGRGKSLKCTARGSIAAITITCTT